MIFFHRYCLSLLAVIMLGFIFVPVGKAEGKGHFPPYYSWSFKGVFGTYDKAALQRGYQVYRQRCASCHSIDAMRYMDLQQIGLTLEQIEKIARKDHILDGKNAQGQDIYRSATIQDFLVKPYFNEAMAKIANKGRLPVDFSRYMLTEENGETHVMAFLLGYRAAPVGFQFDRDGLYYNLYAARQQTAMRPPLVQDGVHYENGVPATIEQQARDVVTFLSWTAHPHLVERHRMGIMMVLYMGFISVLLFFVNHRFWSKIKE